MATWNRDELDDAFQHFMAVTDRCFLSGELEEWVQCFATDARYRDLGYGFNYGWDDEIQGRDAVRRWINGHYAQFPNNAMKYWPVPWYVIDEERGWVLCEWRNRMRDPGTGEIFEEKNYTRLVYAGNRQWCLEEDIYNPLRMRTMISHWLRARAQAEAAGTPLPALDLAWGKRVAEPEQEAAQRWSRAEIEDALRHFGEVCQRAFTGNDHREWLDCFTEDVIYRELGFGFANGWEEELRGRAALGQWIDSHCGIFPIDHMKYFPINWYVIDVERGWVILEWLNQMDDPGNGQHLETPSYTRLKYGGKNQWSFEEDIYDPGRMRGMLARWLDAHRATQNL